jgi:hypothetical protein
MTEAVIGTVPAPRPDAVVVATHPPLTMTTTTAVVHPVAIALVGTITAAGPHHRVTFTTTTVIGMLIGAARPMNMVLHEPATPMTRMMPEVLRPVEAMKTRM